MAEFWKWAIACLIGLAMGCIGFVVDWGINLLNDAKYQSTANVLRSHGMTLSVGPPSKLVSLVGGHCVAAMLSSAPVAGHVTA